MISIISYPLSGKFHKILPFVISIIPVLDMKSYVDACLAGKSEEEQRYQQLIFEFDEKMREKYD